MDDDFLIGPCAYKLRAQTVMSVQILARGISCPVAAAPAAGLDPCNSSKI